MNKDIKAEEQGNGYPVDKEILARRKQGYNCAAATLCGAASEVGLPVDEEILKHLVAGFAGGIGHTIDEGTCGALTGSIVALGIFGKGDDKQTDALAKEIYAHFKETLGSVRCGILKDKDHRTPCNLCCLTAGRKLVEIMEREGYGPHCHCHDHEDCKE